MRIAYLGAYDPDYARHAIITEGLRRAGVDLIEIRLPLKARTPGRVADLLRRFPRDVDAVLVPAFNQLLAPFAWAIAQRYRRPLLLDYMIGLVDAAADRGPLPAHKAFAFRQVDRFNLTRIHAVTDTAAHRAVFERMLGHRLPRLSVLPVGVRDMAMLSPPSGEVIVQYAGTYIPFHGVDVMLEAARLLPAVTFEFIGKGQTLPAAQRDAPANARFITGYFPPAELKAMQARSTIMLGVFGDTAKTRYVIPNKIYEALALGRPIVTAESPALAEYLTPGEHLLTVPPGDPGALAAVLQTLLDNPQEQARLRAAGRQHIEAGLLPQHIGGRLRGIFEGLLA